MMKPRIILQSDDVVKVRCGRSECDVFVEPSKKPVSDLELIAMVRKYQKLTQKSMRLHA